MKATPDKPEPPMGQFVAEAVTGFAIMGLVAVVILCGLWWYDTGIRETEVCPECKGVGSLLWIKDPYCGGDGLLTKWESQHRRRR